MARKNKSPKDQDLGEFCCVPCNYANEMQDVYNQATITPMLINVNTVNTGNTGNTGNNADLAPKQLLTMERR